MVPSQYIPVLQKMAASGGEPDYRVDSRERALEEVDENRKDSKATLQKLFKNTNSVERHQTREVDKALPKKVERDTGNPLLKIGGAVIETAKRLGRAAAAHPTTTGAAAGAALGAATGGKGNRLHGAAQGGMAGGVLGAIHRMGPSASQVRSHLAKVAMPSPHYRAVQRLAFWDELERIAA